MISLDLTKTSEVRIAGDRSSNNRRGENIIEQHLIKNQKTNTYYTSFHIPKIF